MQKQAPTGLQIYNLTTHAKRSFVRAAFSHATVISECTRRTLLGAMAPVTLQFGSTDCIKKCVVKLPGKAATHVAICATVSVENISRQLPEWAAVIHVMDNDKLLLSLPVASAARKGKSTAVVNVDPDTTALSVFASTTMIHLETDGAATVTIEVAMPTEMVTAITCPTFYSPKSTNAKGDLRTIDEPYDELLVEVNNACHRLLMSVNKDSLTAPAIKAIAYGRHNALLKTDSKYPTLPAHERVKIVLAHSAPWIARWIIAWKTVHTELQTWLITNRFELLPKDVRIRLTEQAIFDHMREGRKFSNAGIDMPKVVQTALVLATQYMTWWMMCDVLAAAARTTNMFVQIPVLRNSPQAVDIGVSKDGRPFWETDGNRVDVFEYTAAGNSVAPSNKKLTDFRVPKRRAAGAMVDHA